MNKITGQVIYLGPTIPQIQLQHAMIFKDGIFESLYYWISLCPSIGELIVPMTLCGAVRRELNIDEGRQLRGIQGRYVRFYCEVQNWFTEQKKKQPSTAGVQLNA